MASCFSRAPETGIHMLVQTRLIIVPLKGWKSVYDCKMIVKYLGTTLANKNSIQEEIKSRLKPGNACYYSVQNLLSSSLQSKNTKLKKYRTIIWQLFFYGCETWSLTMREKCRMMVSENSVLRIFGPKRDEVTGEWRKLYNEELNDLYSSPNIFRGIKSRRMRWAGHVEHMGGGGRGEVYTSLW